MDLNELIEDDKENEEENINSVSDKDLPWDGETENNSTEPVLFEENEDAESDNNYILNREKFAAFMDVMHILKISCNNVVITDGMIRQFSNNKSCVIEMDLTNLLDSNANLIIGGINKKCELLEPFRKQNVDVMLKIDKEKYRFMDNRSKLEFAHHLASSVKEDKYFSEEELSQILKIHGDPIFNISMDRSILDRLDAYQKSLAANRLYLQFQKDKAKFSMSTMDQSNSTNVVLLTLSSELNRTDLEMRVYMGMMAFLSCFNSSINELEIQFFNCKISRLGDTFCIVINTEIEIKGCEQGIPIRILAPARNDD